MMKKLAITIFSLVFLSACSANKPYVINEASTYGSIGSSTTVTIIDKRPNEDKEFTFGSYLVFKSDYGIWTFGDDHFSPNLPELLKTEIHKEISKQKYSTDLIKITLERMIIQANHQADLLQSVSTSGSLGPLGILIAEGMHGKDFELDYDKTRPYVIGMIKAKASFALSSGKKVDKDILVSRVENFSHHMDPAGRKDAAILVASKLVKDFSSNLKVEN